MSNYPDDMNRAYLDGPTREQIVQAQIEQDAANEQIDNARRYLAALKSIAANASMHAVDCVCDTLTDLDDGFNRNAVRVIWDEFGAYAKEQDIKARAERNARIAARARS